MIKIRSAIEGGDNMQYVRDTSQDKRIARGDDFAGDGWKDQKTGEVIHTVVGINPNKKCPLCESRDTDFVQSFSGTQTVNGYFEQEVDCDIYYCNNCNREFGD